MPDRSLLGLLAAQGGVPLDSSDLVGSDLVGVTHGSASWATTLFDILAMPQPVRVISGLTDQPTQSDVGRLLEARAFSGSFTVVTLDKDLGVLGAGTDWPSQAILDLQQMGTSRIQIVAAAGATLLAPSGVLSRTQGSLIRCRRDAANHWVVTGDVTTT